MSSTERSHRREDRATAGLVSDPGHRPRYGEGIFPVDVRVVFENKEEVRWHWDGRDRWKRFEVEKPVRASFAQVDPEHVLLLDVRYTNNSLSMEPQSARAARKWSLAWLIWLQDHLLTYGFFV
jgi:hypothetical protein